LALDLPLTRFARFARFGSRQFLQDRLSGEDLALAEAMAEAWYSFAATGQPGGWPRFVTEHDGPVVTLDVAKSGGGIGTLSGYRRASCATFFDAWFAKVLA